MPDLCMCTGKCPVSDYCYRYMAIPNPYGQTYSCLEAECIPDNYSLLIPYNKSIKEDEEDRSIDYTLEDFLLDEIHNTMKFVDAYESD